MSTCEDDEDLDYDPDNIETDGPTIDLEHDTFKLPLFTGMDWTASGGQIKATHFIIYNDTPRPWWIRLRYWLFRRPKDAPFLAYGELP